MTIIYCEGPLLLKETTVNSSPYFDGYPPKNALSNYEDGTYWVPQGQHEYGWFQVILKGSHIITSLEVRGDYCTHMQKTRLLISCLFS